MVFIIKGLNCHTTQRNCSYITFLGVMSFEENTSESCDGLNGDFTNTIEGSKNKNALLNSMFECVFFLQRGKKA